MKQCLIIGVDVSKSTLDIFFKPSGASLTISNDVPGFKKWHSMLKQQCDKGAGILVVMEHTGQYSRRFELFLRSREIGYCKIAALQVKRSLGITRGKNDYVDAKRIAEYGWLRRDTLKADGHAGEAVIKLRSLLSLRSKFVRDRGGYIARLKEMKAAGVSDGYEIREQQQAIIFFTGRINKIDKKIKALITSDGSMHNSCRLLMGIKGIGWVVAANMISCTDNFKRFSNARKFNCYAGIAPFKHQSGSSIKGRARISHLANKEIKTLLSLGASSAIQHDQEMKMYYQRRISEGKHKMSCINIIRAKLVARMFAVIKRQTPYEQFKSAA